MSRDMDVGPRGGCWMPFLIPFVVLGLVLIMLSGCANLKTAWDVATTASVSPTQIIVAGNAFDAAEASATQYLLACKAAALSPNACPLTARRKVVAAVRAGRSARDALEPYVLASSAGPSAIYNALITAIQSLQQNLPGGSL